VLHSLTSLQLEDLLQQADVHASGGFLRDSGGRSKHM